MSVWIFQANPDHYDIDAHLAKNPASMSWLVKRYGDRMDIGDRVFIWRNEGRNKAVAGVIAEMMVLEHPTVRPEDSNAVEFWRNDNSAAFQDKMRVRLRPVRIASQKEVITRDQCLVDPIIADLPNIKLANGTNYPLDNVRQLGRLSALWSKIGTDWSRDEAVAGLWAYHLTYDRQVSELPGSPVSNVALLIGRTVSGVYNKVMNFRAIDTRDTRKGMTGGGKADRDAWSEFYDDKKKRLRERNLSIEFNRLWNDATTLLFADANAKSQVMADEAERLDEKNLTDLIARYREEMVFRSPKPARVSAAVRGYERNSLVVAIARKRAAYRCEIAECKNALFTTESGKPYTEVHHIVPLVDGGDDTIANVACLCPSHHREIHLGASKVRLTSSLMKLRAVENEA